MKGMLFKPDSIGAIIEDRKTQTRRVIKPQPITYDISDKIKGLTYKGINLGSLTRDNRLSIAEEAIIRYARYQVGETVYIKETWCPLILPVYNLLDPTIPMVYKQEMDAGGAILPKEFKWRSPMMMPEWAARYFITITDVRAERVQEISDADCEAEGVRPSIDGNAYDWRENENGWHRTFRQLWDSINKDYPWESNPWVWVYKFSLKEGS